MFWAPQGRQAGCWHGAEPCEYPTCCGALAAAAGAVSFDISPLVIGTHVILSSAAVGQVLHCSVPVFSQVVMLSSYVCIILRSPSLHKVPANPRPFLLPWLSPLGAARRGGGGRRMAEPFVCFVLNLVFPQLHNLKCAQDSPKHPSPEALPLEDGLKGCSYLDRQRKEELKLLLLLPLLSLLPYLCQLASTGNVITETRGSKLVSQKSHPGCQQDGSRLCWRSDGREQLR